MKLYYNPPETQEKVFFGKEAEYSPQNLIFSSVQLYAESIRAWSNHGSVLCLLSILNQ